MNSILRSCKNCSLRKVESKTIPNGVNYLNYCALESKKIPMMLNKQQDYCKLNSKVMLENHIYDILKRQFEGDYYPKFDLVGLAYALKFNFKDK